MSNLLDIHLSLQAVMESGEKNSIALMHCTTSYPCPFENVNLKAMETLKNDLV